MLRESVSTAVYKRTKLVVPLCLVAIGLFFHFAGAIFNMGFEGMAFMFIGIGIFIFTGISVLGVQIVEKVSISKQG